VFIFLALFIELDIWFRGDLLIKYTKTIVIKSRDIRDITITTVLIKTIFLLFLCIFNNTINFSIS
jgi:hypothetical protein